MGSVTEKLESLTNKKKQLDAKARKLQEVSRKEKTKSLIRLGSIVEKAGLLDLDQNALLGALIEIAEKSSDKSNINSWKRIAESQISSVKDRVAIIMSVEDCDLNTSKDISKKHKLKWNSFRKEWYGYADIDQLKVDTKGLKVSIQTVD